MSYEELCRQEFRERVVRSAVYFEQTLREILAKPIELSAKVESNNKQASKRLANALPDLRQAWMSRRYLLTKVAEQGFSVTTYLREKQISMLDALDEAALKPKRERKGKATKAPKEKKPKTWELTFQLYKQGMNPDLIARERGMTVGTIKSHLTRYVESGDIPVSELISPEHQQAIERIVRMVGKEQGSTAVKSLCPPDITYDEIRLVMALMK